MTALHQKLWRDLAGMKGQGAAIALVIGCGVSMFVMAVGTLRALERSQETYYQRYRFADAFVSLKRAPLSVADRLAEIPGVAEVQPRISVAVNLGIDGVAEPIVGQVVSVLPRDRAQLNRLHLRAGRYPERGAGEVVVSAAFAEARGIAPGSRVEAVMNGRRRELSVVGVALSPEFVIEVQPGAIMPDNSRFGILWMLREDLAAAYDMVGGFNDAVLRLMPGASEPEVLRRIDLIVEPYGGLGANGRALQLSHHFVTEEIRGLRSMAVVTPAIFLGVAAFLLNIVLARQIASQREQIAALKAFGYHRRQIGWHYAQFALLITAFGAAFGSVAGFFMGRGMTRMYAEFYRFPTAEYRLEPGIIGMAFALSCAAALLGVLQSIRRAAALPPAEAMRPEPPASFRPTVVERLGLQRFFGQSARMILRQLERRPLRAAISVLAIALAMAIVVFGSFMRDAVDSYMAFQFGEVERQDVTLTFTEPAGWEAIHEAEHLPGVIKAEGFRSVAARLRLGHRSRLVGITGLQPEPDLYRLVEIGGQEHRPGAGLLISRQLARILDAEVGDALEVEVLEKERPHLKIRIDGMIDDLTGLSAYLEIGALNRLMEEDRAVSGARLLVDARDRDALYEESKDVPRIAAVATTDHLVEAFQKTMGDNMLQFQMFNLAFSIAIAFGVVYNSARISLAERGRELATLRVIGFRRGEVSNLLAGEFLAITLLALPPGCVLGWFFSTLSMGAVDQELFRLPVVIKPGTYVFGAAVILVAMLASTLIIRYRIAKLDLVSALKYKE